MEKVPIDELLLCDNSFDIFVENNPPISDLVESGIYCPLPLAGSSLIWGFRTLKQARQTGATHLDCVRIDISDKKEMIVLALKLENRQGSYSWEEKEKIVSLLDDPLEIDETLAGLVGRENPKAEKEKLLRFINLAPGIKKLVTKLGIEPKTASLASVLSPGALSVITESISFGRLTYSEKRIFVEMMSEIVKRDNCSDLDQISIVEQALSSPFPVTTIEKKRFPNLYDAYDKIGRFNNRFFSGNGIDCSAPPYFEGDSFKITFSFTNGKNFTNKIKALQNAADNIDELFDLL